MKTRLRKRREALGMTLGRVSNMSLVPRIIIMDLEMDERCRAHKAYEAYRQQLENYYRILEDF